MQFSCSGKNPTHDIKQGEDRMKYEEENIEEFVPVHQAGTSNKQKNQFIIFLVLTTQFPAFLFQNVYPVQL